MIAVVSQSAASEFVNPRDRQLRAAAATALATSKYAALHKLDCRVSDGVVEITGTVGSFYLKQLAQAAVLQLYPSATVCNLVHVSGESSVLVSRSCAEPGATA